MVYIERSKVDICHRFLYLKFRFCPYYLCTLRCQFQVSEELVRLYVLTQYSQPTVHNSVGDKVAVNAMQCRRGPPHQRPHHSAVEPTLDCRESNTTLIPLLAQCGSSNINPGPPMDGPSL